MSAKSPFARVLRATFVRSLVLASIAFAPLGAQSVESKWAGELMDRFQYYEMAEKVFTSLTTKPDSDTKMEGLLGLAQLKRQTAIRSEDLDLRQKLNEESLEMLRLVCKEISATNPKHFDAQFELADLLQDLANEVVDQMGKGLIPADKIEAIRSKAKNGLDEATVIYEKAKSKFEKVDKEKDDAGWLLGRRALLMSAILRMRKAELIATDPSKIGSVIWDNEVTESLKTFERFHWTTPQDTFIAQVAFLWEGRVLAAMVGVKPSVTAEKVADRFLVPYTNLISLPPTEEPDPDDPDAWIWQRAAPEHQSLAQQASWWLLQFMNERGLPAASIAHGEKLRSDWKALDYEFDIYGRMSLVELARAYQAEGRVADALSLASEVSSEGADAARNEADKLVSIVIKSSPDKSQFKATVLASGANGAFLSKRRDADKPKELECIELYQLVLQNLGKVTDELVRNDLGALAWYRIGVCYSRLDRPLESLVAFENGYRQFNTDKLKSDPKITESLKKAYIYSAQQFKKAWPESSYAKSTLDSVESYVIANPPKNVIGGGVDELQFSKGMQAFGEQKYDDAKQVFQDIAARPSQFQERAMVKLALCEMRLLKAKTDLKEDDWTGAASHFLKFQDYVRANAESDPEKLAARDKAGAEADYYLTQCYLGAVEATTDLAKKNLYFTKVVELTAKLTDKLADELKLAMLWNRYQALEGLGRLDELEGVYIELNQLDAKHQITVTVAARVAKFLKDQSDKMPVDSPEKKAAHLEVRKRSAEYYKRYLVAKKPKSLAQWTLVTNMMADVGDHEGAQALLETTLKEFEGTKNADEKEIFGVKRKIAKCLIERAKLALEQEDNDKTKELFQKAAALYDVILKDPNSPIKGYVSVQEEAAEIYGGFLVGPNRRGNFEHYPGNAEFEKAGKAWEETLKKLRQIKEPESPAEKADLEDRRTRAHFNILLNAFQRAKAESSDSLMKWLRSQLRSLFAKSPNPGGDAWVAKYKWLQAQIP